MTGDPARAPVYSLYGEEEFLAAEPETLAYAAAPAGTGGGSQRRRLVPAALLLAAVAVAAIFVRVVLAPPDGSPARGRGTPQRQAAAAMPRSGGPSALRPAGEASVAVPSAGGAIASSAPPARRRPVPRAPVRGPGVLEAAKLPARPARGAPMGVRFSSASVSVTGYGAVTATDRAEFGFER